MRRRFLRELSRGFIISGTGAWLVWLAACSTKQTSSTPEQVLNNTPVVIGVDLALNGNLAGFGQASQNGILVAQSQINAAGGILGHRVEFRIMDDRTDTPTASANIRALIAAGSPVIIGPTGSPQAAEVHSIGWEGGIPFISPSASSPAIAKDQPARDRFFFRTAASHALQARALSMRAFRGFSGTVACRKVAIIHADDAYGSPIAAGLQTNFTARGGVVAEPLIKVPGTAKANYDTEVQQVINSKADCQIVITFPDVAIGYMSAFRTKIAADTSRDWSTFLSIGSNGLKNDQDFIVKGRKNPAGAAAPDNPTAGEGMYVMNLDLNPQTPTYAQFANLYAAQFPGQSIDGYAANSYDAAALFALAMQDAKTMSDPILIRDALFRVSKGGTAYGPAKLIDAMAAVSHGEDVDYDGASGPVDFDDFGNVLTSFVVFKVENNAFAPLPNETVNVDDLKTSDCCLGANFYECASDDTALACHGGTVGTCTRNESHDAFCRPLN